jgi:hypothetical protein
MNRGLHPTDVVIDDEEVAAAPVQRLPDGRADGDSAVSYQQPPPKATTSHKVDVDPIAAPARAL